MANQLEYAFQISIKAYQQEVDRSRVISARADYLMKWVTLFISVFNIAIPIMVKEIEFDYRNFAFVCLYSLLMLFLIVAMISLTLVNFPKKVKHFPLGRNILEKDQNKLPDQNIDFEIIYNNILMQDVITKKLSKGNDKSVIEIMIANMAIIISIILLAGTFVYIMLNT